MRLVLATVLLSASVALADDCLLTWKAPLHAPMMRNGQNRVYALTERQGGTGAWTALATLPWGTTQHAVACAAPKPRCWQLTLRVLGGDGALMGESGAVETCEAAATPQDVSVAAAAPTPEQVQADVATMNRAHRETSGVNAALAEIAQAEATLGTPPAVLVPLNDHQATIDRILHTYQERISVIWESFTIEREHIQRAPKRDRERLERELWAWAEHAQQQAFIWATQQVDYVLMRETP